MAADDDRDGHRRASPAPPPSDSPSPAPAPPPAHRTRLHGFSFPTLSWGTHRLLRCAKNPASSPPPPAPDTPSPDKEEKAHRSADGGSGSPRRTPARPWNLRTRRSATVAPRSAGWDDAADAAAERERERERAPARPTEAKKKRGFSIALSKREIADDFAAIRGTRPPRRPKKRQRAVQRQLDLMFPGFSLADVTLDSY